MISVEQVISSRFPGLEARSPVMRRGLIALLRVLFRESEFQRFALRYPHLRGFDFVDQVLEHFDFSIAVSGRERERIPVCGRVVIVANHPIGSLDGLALLKLVGEVRRDVRVVANEVLAQLEPLSSLLLPVDNMGQRTHRDHLRAIEKHLQQEGAVIIFPAGEVSRMGPRGVRDGHWRHGFLRFARRSQAPILPVHVDARNSMLFYALSLLSRPLSTLWLVREMFKHARSEVRVRIGHAVEHACYASLPVDQRALVKLFRRHVYKIGRHRGEGCFRAAAEAIAHPEDRQQLRREIRACEHLGDTREGRAIFLYRYEGDSALMRELGRLREISFRAVGEGTGRRRDIDAWDSWYDHILLWDDEALELVGAYRLVRAAAARGALYSESLFEWHPAAGPYRERGVELGRSFVQPSYWGRRSLDELWSGVAAYLRRYPEVRYLFGPVSLSNRYPAAAKALLVSYYRRYYPAQCGWASPRTPWCAETPDCWEGLSGEEAFVMLKARLAELGVSVPTLYKQYTELCEVEGVQFAGFNVDAEFADCIDGLVLVDLSRLKPHRRRRYFGEDALAEAIGRDDGALTPPGVATA